MNEKHTVIARRILPSLAAACLLVSCAQAPSEPASGEPQVLEQKDRGSPKLQDDGRAAPSSKERGAQDAKPSKSAVDVPERVMTVLKYIDEHHSAPKGHEGGREFRNAEQRLPRRNARAEAIKYQEWDVNAKVPGRSRDAERLVTGSDGSAYYTADHYRTFTKIR